MMIMSSLIQIFVPKDNDYLCHPLQIQIFELGDNVKVCCPLHLQIPEPGYIDNSSH